MVVKTNYKKGTFNVASWSVANELGATVIVKPENRVNGFSGETLVVSPEICGEYLRVSAAGICPIALSSIPMVEAAASRFFAGERGNVGAIYSKHISLSPLDIGFDVTKTDMKVVLK